MQPAIRVENLSKQYIIGVRQARRSLRETLSHKLHAPFHRWFGKNGRAQLSPAMEALPPNGDRIWALKDVSFDVQPGEVIGIIGRNGAGKSTLLKLLSRITEPTSGRAEINGRVASLLEVGTGFHHELTGRENVFLNGAILGMKKAEIARRFDDIVAFAEIEKFIDTPVKHYSSGMYMRLAFAVAAHLEPEILVVDEVLAVGDAGFQKKCLGKIGEAAKLGRTVLFVSHNMQAVSTLTSRAVLLSQGRCACSGTTSEVISRYLASNTHPEAIYLGTPSASEPRVTRVEVRTSEPGNTQRNGLPMEVHFEISTPYALDQAGFAFQACNELQQPVMHLWLFDSEKPLCRSAGWYRLVCRIPKTRLYMGRYTLTVHFGERMRKFGERMRKYETIEGICPFEVVLHGRAREAAWQPGDCTYLEDCDWEAGEASPC